MARDKATVMTCIIRSSRLHHRKYLAEIGMDVTCSRHRHGVGEIAACTRNDFMNRSINDGHLTNNCSTSGSKRLLIGPQATGKFSVLQYLNKRLQLLWQISLKKIINFNVGPSEPLCR